MPHQETGGFCDHCQSRVVVRRPSANHVLHLLLTLFTLGLWAIVWIGVSVRFGGWMCTECGGKATTKIPARLRRATDDPSARIKMPVRKQAASPAPVAVVVIAAAVLVVPYLVGRIAREDGPRPLTPATTASTVGSPAPARPAAVPAVAPSRSQIERAIASSDDYDLHREALVAATRRLVGEYGYTLEGIANDGGWTRSTSHASGDVYFTHGGGSHRRDRIYVNVSTGEIFR
jgi:hypothetical protein